VIPVKLSIYWLLSFIPITVILELDESLIRLQEGFCYDYSSLF